MMLHVAVTAVMHNDIVVFQTNFILLCEWNGFVYKDDEGCMYCSLIQFLVMFCSVGSLVRSFGMMGCVALSGCGDCLAKC